MHTEVNFKKCLCSDKFSLTKPLSFQRDLEMLKIDVYNSSLSRFVLEKLRFVLTTLWFNFIFWSKYTILLFFYNRIYIKESL